MSAIVTANINIKTDSPKVEALKNKVAVLEAKTNEIEKGNKPNSDSLTTDKVGIGEVKRGFVPGVKGLFAGAAAGGIASTGAAVIYGVAASGMKLHPGVVFFAKSAGTIGIIAGGMAGATVTQITGDKMKGALIGAGVGAVTGGIAGAGSVSTTRILSMSLLGAISGAVAGTASGYASSFITKTE